MVMEIVDNILDEIEADVLKNAERKITQLVERWALDIDLRGRLRRT